MPGQDNSPAQDTNNIYTFRQRLHDAHIHHDLLLRPYDHCNLALYKVSLLFADVDLEKKNMWQLNHTKKKEYKYGK